MIPCFVFGAASEIDSILEYMYIAGAERDTRPAGLTETVARAAPYQLVIGTAQPGVVGEDLDQPTDYARGTPVGCRQL